MYASIALGYFLVGVGSASNSEVNAELGAPRLE
jgi:hypothetical protein